MMMRTTMAAILGLFVLMFVVTSAWSDLGSKSETKTKKLNSPRLLVVTFYADWCGTCKVLDPKVNAVQEQMQEENKPVLFLILDFTDRKTKQQAELLASVLGMDAGWAEHAGRTGFAILVKPDTGEVVGRLTAAQDANQMRVSIDALIGESREPGSPPDRAGREPGSQP